MSNESWTIRSFRTAIAEARAEMAKPRPCIRTAA